MPGMDVSQRHERAAVCRCDPHRFSKEGFIRAETYRFEDIDELENEHAIKEVDGFD